MSAWPLLTAVLLGVNLGRLGRRGMWIGLCVLVATALALSWVARGQDYPTLIVALIAAATTITIWACVPRETAWHLVALGALAAAGALLCALLDVPEPAASRGWTWAVAALLLADPSTRLLRWGLEALGKPYGELAAHSGRGEAIGVVERWILLIVLARSNYAAMAFLMAAKALARHKRFEEDSEFAEYFLLGTLASVLLAMLVAEALVLLGASLPLGVTTR